MPVLFSHISLFRKLYRYTTSGMVSNIEQILASPFSADTMVEHLIHLALAGGGRDNIGVIVSQFLMNVTAMQTILLPPMFRSTAAAS